MRIIVNHLTRMLPGFICVAGIGIESNTHIRPVCNRVMLPLRWAASEGGVFGLGNVVDLGRVRRRGEPPEVEDVEFREHELRLIDQMPPEDFWLLLHEHHVTRLQRIFGRELKLRGTSCVTDQGAGRASLGVVIPDQVERLYVNARGGVRLAIRIGSAQLDLSVSDLRFYTMDESTATWQANLEWLAGVSDAIEQGTPCMLCVGLTRAFKRHATEPAYHWLQVNNIHLGSDPLGEAMA